jgi:hypothetical protein
VALSVHVNQIGAHYKPHSMDRTSGPEGFSMVLFAQRLLQTRLPVNLWRVDSILGFMAEAGTLLEGNFEASAASDGKPQGTDTAS